MVNTTIGPPVDRLAKVNNLLMSIEGEKCLDFKYSNIVSEMENVSWDSSVAAGGKLYSTVFFLKFSTNI